MSTPNSIFIAVNPFAPEGDRPRYILVRADAIDVVHYGANVRGECAILVGGVWLSVTRESGDCVCDALGLVRPGDRL